MKKRKATRLDSEILREILEELRSVKAELKRYKAHSSLRLDEVEGYATWIDGQLDDLYKVMKEDGDDYGFFSTDGEPP